MVRWCGVVWQGGYLVRDGGVVVGFLVGDGTVTVAVWCVGSKIVEIFRSISFRYLRGFSILLL